MASGSEQYSGVNKGRASRASGRASKTPKQGYKNSSNPKSKNYVPF